MRNKNRPNNDKVKCSPPLVYSVLVTKHCLCLCTVKRRALRGVFFFTPFLIKYTSDIISYQPVLCFCYSFCLFNTEKRFFLPLTHNWFCGEKKKVKLHGGLTEERTAAASSWILLNALTLRLNWAEPKDHYGPTRSIRSQSSSIQPANYVAWW